MIIFEGQFKLLLGKFGGSCSEIYQGNFWRAFLNFGGHFDFNHLKNTFQIEHILHLKIGQSYNGSIFVCVCGGGGKRPLSLECFYTGRCFGVLWHLAGGSLAAGGKLGPWSN